VAEPDQVLVVLLLLVYVNIQPVGVFCASFYCFYYDTLRWVCMLLSN